MIECSKLAKNDAQRGQQMSTSPQYPYDTRLNVLHQHLELIDEKGAFGLPLLTSGITRCFAK